MDKKEIEKIQNIIPSVVESQVDDDDEDDGPQDQKANIEQQCMETKECAPIKAKFDTCQERVNANPDGEETCVEEFFDLMHCVHKCAPEKYFHHLK